jgi:hypothetical protein|tara:strand:- start:1277 stop:1462 length:186 start_codon:yes stop_codon:yes gene_type:complete
MSNYDKCIYPDCIGNVVNGKSINGLCIKHSDLLNFFIWSLDNIQVSNEEKEENLGVDVKES